MNVRVPPVLLSVLVGAAAVAPFVAAAGAKAEDEPSYSMEDVTACSADAMRLCRSKMPNIKAIEDCMKDNYDKLRPKCKARFNR